jgi:predicted SnoaL-like aldol condensation-catalyzing enzyme
MKLGEFMNEQLEMNKKIVLEFTDLAFIQRKPEEAVAKFHGPYYRQHNPSATDGSVAFIGFVKWFAQTYPSFQISFKRIIAEGDLVMTHSHLVREPGDRGNAIVDIFRLENGKIVEHWDVVQEIPETSANNNTMF